MTDYANTTLSAIQTLQAALAIVQSLTLTAYNYPPNCALTNGTYYDYIVVGAGTAGCVLASRLSENKNYSVLLIEAGGYPPIESELTGLFPLMVTSDYDYNIYSVNDSYSGQNLQDSHVALTQGKMVGGSSSLHHAIHVQGYPNDFNNWANILGDNSLNYSSIQKYFDKMEKLVDPYLLTTKFSSLHGTEGNMKIQRQTSSSNTGMFEAFKELGYSILDDVTSATSSRVVAEPLFGIADNVRQSGSLAYLGPASERSNLCLALSTTVTKILIENGTAVGVQLTTSSGDTYVLYANKEVLVSAGAINSPKLLMLSGIGPQAHLESFGIEVVADLPVGQNFMDHPSAILLYQMEESTETAAAVDYHKFPVPTTTSYWALDSSQSYPDYQAINLLFPHDSAALLQLCSNSFKFSNDICNKFYEASFGRTTLFVVLNLMMPVSRGQVLLASADPTVAPLVYTGTYSNSTDLTLMSECLADFSKVINTTYFESVNATFVNPGLCLDKEYTALEFWKCYGLEMSGTMWHYSGTCAMGSVVDTSMKLIGVNNCRVADASIMPTEVSGNINTAVAMLAERCADLIISERDS